MTSQDSATYELADIEDVIAVDLRNHEARMEWALKHVAAERVRQDAKWGDIVRRHLSDGNLALILIEEVGELAHALLRDNPDEDHTLERQFQEAVQVAAVATAIIEVLGSRYG